MDDTQGLRLRAGIMAGIFYPESEVESRKALAGYDQDARKFDGDENAQAIIVPHAGWELGGRITAAAFRAVRGRTIKTAVVIGPLHSKKPEGLFLSDSDRFVTPLGSIEVDADLSAELASCGTSFIVNDIPHLDEHSIEIVVPFIQYYFPEAHLVPVLISGSKSSAVRALSRALDLTFAPFLDTTLFIVSSNASDHVEPNRAADQADAFIRLALAKDADGLLAAAADGSIGACGAAAGAALIGARFLAGSQSRLIAAEISRPETETKNKQVRYAAIAYKP